MTTTLTADVAVIGGGIVGLGVAHELTRRARSTSDIVVLEKDSGVGRQQSGHNSGVVHSGLYYEPGSLKARLCVEGRSQLRAFCLEHDVRYEQCGKVVVATTENERARLDDILLRARANQVQGVRQLSARELREKEPHVEGLAAIWSPETAIVDFPGVCHALADAVTDNGGDVRCNTRVVGIDQDDQGVTLSVDERGHRLVVQCRQAVICAGLHADRLARLAGGSSQPRIIPFRGEYYALTPEHRHLVNGLVYPVPDPRYPFLGIHLTKHVDGNVLIGPNAILALAREGYRRRDLRVGELFGTLTDHGFRAMARQHWRTGAAELASSLVRRVFVARAQKYLPELSARMVVRAQAGVRAQAVDPTGHLIDDFVLENLGRVLAVRNAPSPAATSSLAIARHLVEVMYSSK